MNLLKINFTLMVLCFLSSRAAFSQNFHKISLLEEADLWQVINSETVTCYSEPSFDSDVVAEIPSGTEARPLTLLGKVQIESSLDRTRWIKVFKGELNCWLPARTDDIAAVTDIKLVDAVSDETCAVRLDADTFGYFETPTQRAWICMRGIFYTLIVSDASSGEILVEAQTEKVNAIGPKGLFFFQNGFKYTVDIPLPGLRTLCIIKFQNDEKISGEVAVTAEFRRVLFPDL